MRQTKDHKGKNIDELEPTPWYHWVAGGAILLAGLALCLFSLWPSWAHLGIIYFSQGLLAVTIALAIVRYVFWAILFALSGGKLSFWILPNLTEDVDFFKSFWPLYDYKFNGNKGKKKAKDSDDEESDDGEENEKNEEADHSESDDSSSKKSSLAGRDFEMVD